MLIFISLYFDVDNQDSVFKFYNTNLSFITPWASIYSCHQGKVDAFIKLIKISRTLTVKEHIQIYYFNESIHIMKRRQMYKKS